MNVIALDVGNTNITIGLFINDEEKVIEKVSAGDTDKITEILITSWERIPVAEVSREKKRNGIIVMSSVNTSSTVMIEGICKDKLGEKVQIVGRDFPLPIEMGVDDALAVGTDRVVGAAAAFAVVEDAVVVADLGTAITIDLVDEDGVFLGGVIAPGFSVASEALKVRTDKLPKLEVNVRVPKNTAGGNTLEAINNGLYYSAAGLLKFVVEKYAEDIGRWPHVIVTGGAGSVIKPDCDFVDSWVPNLAVRGVVLAYKKFLEEKTE